MARSDSKKQLFHMKCFVKSRDSLSCSNAGTNQIKENTVASSELCQTSKMEKFAKNC